MSIFTILQPLLTATDNSNSSFAPTGQPSLLSYLLTGLVTLLVLLVMFQLQGDRDRRKQALVDKEKNQEQMAAVNQSLTLLLSKQTDTTTDLSEATMRVKVLETQQSAYDVSLALLKQEIQTHIRSSEEDRRRLHDDIDSIRDGLVSNRRSNGGRDTRSDS